jgi:superfamily II DNA or RNA helicase
MYRYYLNQPGRQQLLSVAQNDAASQGLILTLKREPHRDLSHDNLKYAGQKFLLQKTAEELNACQEFARYKQASQEISTELLRQKIKEFQDAAVAASEESIDRRNVFLLFINFKMKMTFSLQIESSGRSILDWCTLCSRLSFEPFNKSKTPEFKIGSVSTTFSEP